MDGDAVMIVTMILKLLKIVSSLYVKEPVDTSLLKTLVALNKRHSRRALLEWPASLLS